MDYFFFLKNGPPKTPGGKFLKKRAKILYIFVHFFLFPKTFFLFQILFF